MIKTDNSWLRYRLQYIALLCVGVSLYISIGYANSPADDVSVVVRKGHPYDVNTNAHPMKPPQKRMPGIADPLLGWAKDRANLRQVLIFALNNHPTVLAAKAQKHAAEYTLRDSQSGLLPKVDAEYAYGHERTDNPATRTAGNDHVNLMRQEKTLRIQQLLYDGGKVWNRIKRDKANVKANKYTLMTTRETVGLRVINAYLNLLRFRESLEIAIQDVQAHRDNLEKMQKRLKGGAGRKSELALAKARFSEAQARYQVAQTRVQSAEHVFVQEVGKAPPHYLTKAILQPSQLPQQLANAKMMAIKNNPAITAAQTEVEVAGDNVASLRANYLPDVSLNLEASRNNELDGVRGANNEELALIRVSYNLFNGGSDHAKIKQAIAERHQALQELAEARRDIDARVATAWTDVQTIYARYKVLQQNVQEAHTVVQSYQQEFSLGQRSLLNVLDAENEYFRTRVNLVEAHFSYLLSQYRVLEATGMLTATVLAG